MPPVVDRTGQRFGRLVVLERGENVRGHAGWICRCDCGNTITAGGGNLASGNSQSCGCLARELVAQRQRLRRGKYQDLTGRRFGRYAVLQFVELRKDKPFWLCRCDCGIEKVVMAQSLTQGKIVSCGCYHHEELSKRAFKHGRSGTAAYKRIYKVRRRDRESHLDRFWTRKMEQTLQRLQKCCVICGATGKLVTDHVQPLSRGHGLQPGNATRLCASCNSKKHCKELHELPISWQQRLKTAAVDFEHHWSNIPQKQIA